MSYEGYTEALCEDGHYHTWDAYWDPPALCIECGKSLVWFNEVDQTNGDGEDMKAKLEVLEEAKVETCPTCHHKNEVAEVRYKIPKKD